MKNRFFPIFALILILLIPSLCVDAFAANITESTAFEFQITKSDAQDTPGDIKVDLYCKTDPAEQITTLGATLVVNTDYVDLVDYDGKSITNQYKADSTVLDSDFPLKSVKVGKKAFSSMHGLSIASYNASSKNMYLFVCGMSMNGIKIPEKSLVATFYLQTKKDGAFPPSAVRTMEESERGGACPTKAIFANEISTKKEIGKGVSPMGLNVDSSLLSKEPDTTEAPTAEPTTVPTTAPTTQADIVTPSEEQTTVSSEAQEQTTKAVEEMTETEIETEIEQKIAVKEGLKLPEKVKKTKVFQTYEKAVEKAEKVLEDKSSSKQQKQEALKELREAEQAVKQAIPEAAEQMEKAEKEIVNQSKTTPWLFIGIGSGAAVLAAIIIVLILRNKKKKN